MALRVDDVDLGRDRLLVEACQAGDPAAFEALYRRYFDRLRRFCQRRVGDPVDAEELAQEAFTRAFQALPRLAGDRRFYPWVTVIADRLCIDHHRRRERVEPSDSVDPGVVDDDRAAGLVRAEDLAALDAALGRLAHRHAEVLDLRERRALKYQQIADELGVPQSTVETLLFRARRALRREYLAVSGGRLGALPPLVWLRDKVGRVWSKFGGVAESLVPLSGPAAAGVMVAGLVLGGGPAAPVDPSPPRAARAAVHATALSEPAPAGLGGAAGGTGAARSADDVDGDRTAPPTTMPRRPLPVGQRLGVENMSSDEASDRASDMPIAVEIGDLNVATDPAEVPRWVVEDLLQEGTP